jgi:superfamily II DNA or RNA helicase
MHTRVPLPGSIVWVRQRRWRIERARMDHGVVQLDVADRSRRRTFLVPFDRPTSIGLPIRPCAVRPPQAVARLAGLAAYAGGVRTPMSALTAEITLHPHQFEPVLAVLDGARRVLVADEVGLGKTIQAGLVLAELMIRMPSLRALAIVPAALRGQWVQELAARFGVHATPADRRAFDVQQQTAWRGDSPWLRTGVSIASLDFLKQRHIQDALPFVPWDLVIVDEAHDACGDSDRHEACAAILRRARHVLLLTATPHSGDLTRFNRLVSLGALPGLPDTLTVFRRTRADLAWPASRRIRWTSVRPSPPEARVLDALMAFERQVLGSAGTAQRNAALLLLSVFRKRALSTMAALDRSLERRQDWLRSADGLDAPFWTQPRLAFDEEADDFGEEERADLSVSIGVPSDRERIWLGRLRLLTQAAIPHDSKVSRLVRLIARVTEPVVIFTEFRDSLRRLCDRLAGPREVAALHGGQSSVERTRELDRFLGGSASILVATDVAGQGLNLQRRARWVISLELPWSPARIEQRVGRVDRIGQSRPVHASLLVARHEAERGLLTRLSTRALTARRTFAGNALQGIAPPSQVGVAAALLAGAPEPQPAASPETPPLCRRWTVGGRAVARLLARKRRLASHWRTRVDTGHRPVRTTLRRRGRLSSIAAPAIAIFRTPLVNRAGAVVEPHYLAVAVNGSDPSMLADPRVLAEIAARARARLQGRRERVRRLLVSSACAAAAVDQAMTAHLRATVAPAEDQPDLFINRGMRARAMSGRRLEAIDGDAEARRRADDDDQDLSVGPPVLEMFGRLPR